MYGYQLMVAFYEDAYMDTSRFMDTNQLIYLAPFFIIILSIVYLIRIKIFDRVYGFDLSEIERGNLSPFSSVPNKDYQEMKKFREEDQAAEPEEDYYVKL